MLGGPNVPHETSSALRRGPPLVCPSCRGYQGTRFNVAELQLHPLGWVCPHCQVVHPVVDATALVLPDLNSWLASEAISLFARRDLEQGLQNHLLDRIGGPLARDRDLTACYAASKSGDLQTWARKVVDGLRGPVLDIGCGAGIHDREDAIGMDLNWTLLQEFPGSKVLADALNPPFRAASFASVVVFNLLDSCRDPWIALQQAAALVAPEGTLVISSAFAWRDDVTPVPRQIQAAQVDDLLARWGFTVETGEQQWVLHPSPRSQHLHVARTWLARAAAPSVIAG
jgi:SAM-dependent methyltransferase